MQGYIDSGASVTLIGCDASLPICDVNPEHDLSMCLQCISKRKQGLRMLTPVTSINYISLDDLFVGSDLPAAQRDWNFSTIEQLNEYKIDQYDIGMSVASSLMSYYRTPTLDFVSARDKLHKFLFASYRTYYAIKNYLLSERPDEVYIFNGRFAILRSVFRLCQQYAIDCFIHERGANIYKYSVTKNALPHDISNKVREIQAYWDKAPPDRRVPVAEQFYYDRAGGKQQSWFSFVANQEKGLLPECWDPQKRNLVIFNSSEDEFSSIGEEWKNHLYQSQLDGLRRIVADLSVQKNVHVYLRMHPNLTGVHNESVEGLYHITGNNFTLIPPESKISTYALIRAANTVMSFGSTVGIEAAFWGKPSILAGKSFYRELGSVYLPMTHEEVIRMALSNLEPKDRTGALMYGYYLNTFGRDYKYFEAHEIFSGRFKGKFVRPSIAIRSTCYLIDVLRLQKLLPLFIKSTTAGTG